MRAKKKTAGRSSRRQPARRTSPAAPRTSTAARGTKAPSSARAARGSTSRSRVERGPNREPEHVRSATAVAAEALRTGVLEDAVPRDPRDDALPGEAERIRVGDPDDEPLLNEYVGEETPGGSTPTPDQSNVDEIGRAYGVQDEDGGELRTSSELMQQRDQRRRGLGVKNRRS